MNPLSFPPLTEPPKRQETNRETITALPIFDKPPGVARVGTLFCTEVLLIGNLREAPGPHLDHDLVQNFALDRRTNSAYVLAQVFEGENQTTKEAATKRLSVRTLLGQAHLSGSYGGIEINVANGAGYLKTAHFLFDEIGGFSALLKMFDRSPDSTFRECSWGGVKEWTTRAPMLALTDPDPALGFPAGTKLQPEVLVRNTFAKTYTAHIRFNWRSAVTSGKSAPIELKFRPNETRVVDVAALQAQKLLPADAHWASVIISAPVQPDDLMAVATSYDHSGRYGTQTPFNDQLSFHWEAGKWEVDSMHNSLVTVGNGGNKTVRAQLTIFYNQGQDKYWMEQTLAPDEQVWLDFGKLIHDRVPDKDGHALPPDLTSGSYQIRDLTDIAVGNLYEGKVILDKTNGHAAYGCAWCCGFTNIQPTFDPLGVLVLGSNLQSVTATDGCTGTKYDITSSFDTWWTGNTAIATASGPRIYGVAAGSTNHYAQGEVGFGHEHEPPDGCPTKIVPIQANTNVGPYISSLDPSTAMIGSSGTQITINGWGFGTSPTVNLPSGITSTGQGNTDTKIVITVNIAFTATVGNNSITVTAGGHTSNSATFAVDGPYHMIVEGDLTGPCSGCSTTVARQVTYQVQNFSGTNAAITWIAENIAFSGWSCTQQEGHQFAQCPQNDQTSSFGTFTDQWTMSSDAYTPIGCGFNVTYDHWQWCKHSPAQTLGTLTGYVHTDKVSINGVVSPNKMSTGTVIPF